MLSVGLISSESSFTGIPSLTKAMMPKKQAFKVQLRGMTHQNLPQK